MKQMSVLVKKTSGKVVYVHPETPMFYRFILPMSLPALINRIPSKVAGVYESELRRESLHNVSIVIMDIHWYLSLRNAVALAKYIKRKNPSVHIIAGGITASIFADILVDTSDIDYIVRGDGERPLPMLVQALLRRQKNLKKIPNIVGKHGLKTSCTYVLTQKDIDENKYYDIDFFPSFKKDIEKAHRHYSNWTIPVFPYLLPFRGCPIGCHNCAGGAQSQKILFHRKCIVRSAKRFKEDLDLLSKNAQIKFVNSHLDFVSLLPEKFVKEVLGRKYSFDIRHEFARLPSDRLLIRFLESFHGGTLGIPIDKYHVTSKETNDVKNLIRVIEIIKKYKRYLPVLYYTSRYAVEDRQYAKAVNQVLAATKCHLYKTDFFWGDAPSFDALGQSNMQEYTHYYRFSRGQKYRLLNLLCKLAIVVDRFFPKQVSSLLKTLPYAWDKFVFYLQYWRTGMVWK
jgi:hypothetical protein